MTEEEVKKQPIIDMGMNLYEMNKQAMKALPPLDAILFNKKTADMIKDTYNRTNTWWMLLSNERKDYTVFKMLTIEGSLKAMRECLDNRGNVLSIDKNGEAYEIWIRDEDNENFVYYFFPYDEGIIME